MRKKIKENRLYIFVFIIYAIVSFTMIFFHESWRDEAQQWLIARDLSFTGIIKQMKYEGHFALWYLILMPFAKLGFPYITKNIISWFICNVSAILILKKAPFSKWKKVLLIFSYPMIYLYPVISRCYCLVPLSIVLICILYKQRYEKPIKYILSIVLLTNTHVIMLGMVSYLLIDFYYGYFKIKKTTGQKKYIKISIVLSIVLITFSGLPLLGCLANNKDVGSLYPIGFNILSTFILQPLVLIQNNFDIFWNNEVILAIVLVLSGYLVYYGIKYDKSTIFRIYFILLWQFLIYGFLYGMSSQRAGTVIFIIMFFAWNKEEKTKNIKDAEKIFKNISIIGLIGISIINGLVYYYIDIKYYYSSAEQTAEYINKNLDENSIILTGNQPEFCSSIMAYTDKVNFYYIQREDYFTYVILDDINRKELTIESFEDTKEKFLNKDLYYIYEPYRATRSTDKEIIEELENNKKITKIFESSESLKGEDYIIFKVN